MSYVAGALGDIPAAGMGWVLTHLQSGDMLSTLEKAYNVPARTIVTANGVPFNSVAVEGDGGWVQSTGGKKLPGQEETLYDPRTGKGRWVFSGNSKIFLPPGGPRPAVKPGASETAPSPVSDVSEAGTGPSGFVVGLVAVGLGLLLLAPDKKKRKTPASTGPKVTRWTA